MSYPTGTAPLEQFSKPFVLKAFNHLLCCIIYCYSVNIYIQSSIHNHLLKMPVLAKLINADLSRGFTVAQVAEKHNWTEPMVWSLALEAKEDLERFKELSWGLRTWDLWEWNDCLPREIYVNDSEAYFTGATDDSGTTGRGVSRPN
jgi:hypothetical protein